MTTTQYSNMGCPRTIADNEPVPLRCEVYRRVCTNTACPPAHILSAADYQCYPTAETQGPSSSTNSSGSSNSTTPPDTSAFRRPMNWRPRVLSPEKRRRIAADILHGVSNGVAVGAAIQEYNRQG
ncbi:hypothetical protein IOCL2690_000861600 [Leishmania lindenbergi]|uniref:Uncharacterized protein n=1 Tax=Leishmania lindenbergi TaxID=651832 RepID=A0AAW2ZVC0_9TRYP